VIQYSLSCENDHRFDAWFRNAAAFDEQSQKGIVTCPICATGVVHKALMAPAIAKKQSQKVSLSAGHPDQAQLRQAMRALREKVVAEADYVGDRFAQEARRIHDKETEPRGIYGEATTEEVSGLVEDGIDFMPLPNLPEDHN
jgi:hypothetical protein